MDCQIKNVLRIVRFQGQINAQSRPGGRGFNLRKVGKQIEHGRVFLQGAGCRVQGAGWNLIITGKPLAFKRNVQVVDLPWLLHDAVYNRSERWLPPKCQTRRSDGRRVYSYDFKPAMNYCFFKKHLKYHLKYRLNLVSSLWVPKWKHTELVLVYYIS